MACPAGRQPSPATWSGSWADASASAGPAQARGDAVHRQQKRHARLTALVGVLVAGAVAGEQVHLPAIAGVDVLAGILEPLAERGETERQFVAADDVETPVESFCPLVCEEYELMHCLMSRVEEVHQQPHEATLALIGLTALCREMPQLRTSVSWKAVERCHDFGSAQNFALEQASRKFLEAR